MNRALNEFTAGSQKTGKRRTTARRLVAAGLVLACLGAASPIFADFGSDVTLKLGSSGLFNHRLVARQGIVGLRQAGGHISLDITVPDRAIAFSPFLDIYHRVQRDATGSRPASEVNTSTIGGVNFLFTGPRKHDRATMYFGIGGGVTRLKVATAVVGPVVTTGYKTKLMADALIGLEVKMTPKVSLFLEPHYVWATKMLNGLSAHAGLAFHLSKAITPVRPATPVRISEAPVQRAPDPVKVEEVKVTEIPPKSLDASQDYTMRQTIYFAHDKSDISDASKSILNDKVTLFRSNPEMRILIVGFASQPGTDPYNMALGMRRSVAAKDYLVSKGVDPTHIEIGTRGEGQLAVEGPGEVADAQNRRGQFRLLIADPYLEAPHAEAAAETERLGTDAASLATMKEMVYFANNQSDISEAAKTILNDKVVLFRSNPGMRILIVGFASQPGTEAYNMALGMQRAVAAKAYLVSKGVHETRIEIATRGKGELVVQGPGEVSDAQNQRDQFRLLITDPPKK